MCSLDCTYLHCVRTCCCWKSGGGNPSVRLDRTHRNRAGICYYRWKSRNGTALGVAQAGGPHGFHGDVTMKHVFRAREALVQGVGADPLLTL